MKAKMVAARPVESCLIKRDWLSAILGLALLLAVQVVRADVTGDYRSKNTGTWSTATDWETYNGTSWVTASSKPTSANNVFIQAGHVMTLSGNEACNDFHLSTGTTDASTGGDAQLVLAANTLQINGKARCYFGAVGGSGNLPGTSSGTLPSSPITITAASAGKISFVGNSRTTIASGEWGSANTAATTTYAMEVAMNSGQTATFTGPFKVSALTVSSGTMDVGGTRISVDTGSAGSGSVTIASGAILRSSSTGTGAGSQVISRTGTAGSTTVRSGTLTINSGGKLQLSGATPCADLATLNLNGTVEYTRAGAQTFLQPSGQDTSGNAVAAVTYTDLILNGSGAKTLATNLTLNGTLSMQGTASLGLSTFSRTYGASSTLEYAGSSAQTTTTTEFPASSGPNSLKINNASGVTLAASSSRTIPGTLTLTSGAFSIGANVLTLNGAISQTSGTLTGGATSDIVFGGSGASTALPAVTLQNLTLNRANGISLAGNVTVGGTLTFTSGKLTTSANTLSLAAGASISGASSSQYVVGNLKKSFNTGSGQSFSFPIGDSSNYLPVALASMNVSVAGDLTPAFTATDHPNLNSPASGIDSAKSVNRYWTLAAGGSFAASGDVTFNYLAGDVDGGATPANFLVKRYNGSSWSSTTISGTPTSTSTAITGATVAGDFAIGETSATPTSPSASSTAATPATVNRNDTTLLTVTVAPGANPTSSGLAVTVDLSAIGGSATQAFYDDNTHGDVTPGDNVFSYSTTIPTGTTLGSKSFAVSITDAETRSGSSAIGLTVTATARTWSGSAGDDNWTSAANWNSPPGTNGDSVIFAGSTRTTPSLDAAYTVTGVTFDSGAASFTLGATGGSTLTLNGGSGVTNNSANAQTINVPLIMGAAQTFNAAGAGTLVMANTVDNGGNLLTVAGANNSSFNGAVSGGGGVTKIGNGTLTLAGTNSYGGATTVSAGTVAVAGGSGIPDGSLVTLSNVAGVTLSLSANETIGSLTGGGAAGGTVALGANNLTVGGTTTYSGSVSGTGKLIKAGAGTLTLNSASAIGSSFTTRIEGGTVELNRNTSALAGILGAGNRIELAGGTLQISATNQANAAFTAGGADIYGDSTIRFNRLSSANSQSPNITLPLNFKNNATLSVTFNASVTNGTHTFNGATNTLEADATLDVSAYTVAIVNPIVETGGSWSLTKTGAGTLNLEDINTYTGGTTNLAGTIAVDDVGTFGDVSGPIVFAGGDLLFRNSRPASSIDNPIVITDDTTIYGNGTLNNSTRIAPLGADSITTTAGTLTVRNGGTTAGVVGNVFSLRLMGGGFNITQPVVVGHASDVVGYTTQIEFYNDDTQADQTISGVISGTGSLARNAAAAGGRTILTGANTYAGTTTIARGTLLVNNTTGSGTSTGAVSVTTSGILGGTGTVGGVVSVGAGGTIAPGVTIGTLTLSSAPALGGTVLAEVNQAGSPSADKLVLTTGTLTYGGTLVITNLGATATNGTFTLFNAPAYSGAFTNFVLPPGGLAHWKTNNLVVDGSVTFTNNAPVAKDLTVGVLLGSSVSLQVIGGKNGPTDADSDSLVITDVGAPTSGEAGFTSSNLTYVASGTLGTNTFTYTIDDGAGGTDTKTVTVVVSNPQGFNQMSATSGGGNAYLTYLGIPGASYALEVTHELPATNWVSVMTNTAAVNGYLYLTNEMSLSPTNDYYRTRYVP